MQNNKYNVTILEHLSRKVFFYIVSKPTSSMVFTPQNRGKRV